MNNQNRHPLKEKDWLARMARGDVPYSGLVSSLVEENSYECDLVGTLPEDLEGILFRTGPGIFERGGQRRRLVIDADGMMRKFEFSQGKITFSSRHIRTSKYVAEEKAGRYLYPSFGMLVPGRPWPANSAINIENQASVTAFSFGGRVFATDEMQSIIEIEQHSLATLPTSPFGDTKYKAHTRITDTGSPRLHLARMIPQKSSLQFVSFDENFREVSQTVPVKLSRYFHDWLVTPNFYVAILPPVVMDKWKLLKALAGASTISDALCFNSNLSTQVLVVPQNGGPHSPEDPVLFDLGITLDSWHSVNAFETEGGLIVDFVGSKLSVNAASNESPMCQIMRGELATDATARATSLYRSTLRFSPQSAVCRELPARGIEMPVVSPRDYGFEYENAYCMAGNSGLDSQLVRFNMRTSEIERFDFGPGRFVTEPVYAPSSRDENRGYLLSEVYCHDKRRSMLAILDAQNLKKGPLAEVWLRHHLPIGFHGVFV